MTRAVLCATTADVDRHETGTWHPERAARLPAVERALSDDLVREMVGRIEARQATLDELALAHAPGHLDALERFVTDGGGALDADTVTSKGSWETALWAAGTGLAAVDALASSDAAAAFVGIRPPGHHATADQAMGFCLINNMAVVAASLAARGDRVAIFDWDVHHGNGTQDIFWDRPDVLYASVHEHPAYPGTGRAYEIGGAAALGSTINVPLPEGSTGGTMLAAFDEIIGPEIERFGPDWLLISAGYDAHRADPLAGLSLSAGDYGLLAARSAELVPNGRIVVLLEGGYDLDALTNSVTSTVAALAGSGAHDVERPTGGVTGMAAVATAARARQRAIDTAGSNDRGESR
ncbi:MAG: histone deacetylase family protein [Acidimicrobiales bacterium]